MIGLEAIIGSITGVVGGIATAVANYKLQKLKNEHDKAMAEFDIRRMEKEMEIIKTEADANIKITKAEIEGAIELEEVKGYTKTHEQPPLFQESYMKRLSEAEGWTKYLAWPALTLVSLLFGAVDFLKALMRPALTVYHVVVTTWVTVIAWNIVKVSTGQPVPPEKAFQILNQAIDTVLYLTVTCVTWWFFDRRTAKFLHQIKGSNK